MIKKIILGLLAMTVISGAAYGMEDARMEECTFKCAFQVAGRGVVNFATIPAELVTAAIREEEIHPKVWPLTYLPRVVNNAFIRGFSSLNDFFIYPWLAPSAETLPQSIATGVGLPEYAWQVHNDE